MVRATALALGERAAAVGAALHLALFGATGEATAATREVAAVAPPLLPPRATPHTPASNAERRGRVRRLALNVSDRLQLHVRQQVMLAAVPLDANGNTVHGVVAQWTSSDQGIVHVTRHGLVRARQAGAAQLVATLGSASAMVRVRVVADGEIKEEPQGSEESGQSASDAVNEAAEDAPAVAAAEEDGAQNNAAATREIGLLRPPDDGMLPDPETPSLYMPINDVGMPPGRTEPGAITPPSAAPGRETPTSSNFMLDVPLVGLPGRGLNVALSLSYNSRLWNSSTAGGQTRMTYDVDAGWPAPGFRLGYGQLERQGDAGFTLVEANGTRRQMLFIRTIVGNVGEYETTDGTFIRLRYHPASASGTITYPNGTQVEYAAQRIGQSSSVYSYPIQITDRNGNFIMISYVGGVGPWLSSVQDTLGRYALFHYSGDDLVAITVPGYAESADRQVVRCYYEDLPLTGTFQSGIMRSAPATTRVIRHLYFPGTQTGYRYDYSAYGMIYHISQRRGMTISTTALNQMGMVSSEGQEAATTTYNYPVGPSTLAAAPAYSRRTDDWAGRTTGMGGTMAAPYTTFDVDGAEGTQTITAPDGTVSETRTIVNPGVWDDGLVIQTSISQGSATLARTEIDWEHDGNQRNRRPREVSMTDEAGARKRMRYEYTSFNNVVVMREYDFDVGGAIGAELRRTETEYEGRAQYLERRLLHLPTSWKLFAGGAVTPTARMDFVYDDYATVGALVERPGITMHMEVEPWRGNPTISKRYPVASDLASAITDTKSYDVAGNVVTETVDCCQQRSYAYDAGYNYAYQTMETRGAAGGTQLSTSAVYDFDTGLLTAARDENEQTATMDYDVGSLRPRQMTRPDGGTTLMEYFDSLVPNPDAGHLHSYVRTQTALDAGRVVTALSYRDGRGAQARQLTLTPQGHVTVDIEYDVMGRAYRASNPYYSTGEGAAINPAGLWTTSQYDGLGRVPVTTLPDGNTVRTEYAGTVVTVFDQASRQRRSVTDALGRMIRVDEPDAAGNLGAVTAPAQQTVYQYDAQDNLVRITQGVQNRYFRYDSMSRLTHERQVEHDAPHTFNDPVTSNNQWSKHMLYNPRSQVTDVYDARNIQTHFEYDGLQRVREVTYSDGTPTATYTYDEARSGFYNRGRLTTARTAATSAAPQLRQLYSYDRMGRLTDHQQEIGATVYAMTYGYNLLDQMVSQSYPSGRVVTHTYDSAARLASVADAGRSYVSGLSYAAHGGLQNELWGNGAEHSREYNVRLQMRQIRLSVGGQEVRRFDYSFGVVDMTSGTVDVTRNTGQIGRIESRHDNGANNYSHRYQYDSLGRLDMAAEHLANGNLNYRSDFDYDRYGNRYRPGAGTQNFRLFYTPVELSEINPQTNRYTPLSPASVTYDGAGNITAEQKFRQWRYGYDANSRLVQSSDIDGRAVSTASYDGAGQRTQTTIGPEWHHFIYDAMGRVIAEYGIEGWTRDRIYRGGEMIATVESKSGCRKTIEQFVQAFYFGVLGRFATSSELNEWAGRLRQAQTQGQAQLLAEAKLLGTALFTSSEYLARSRTDREFVRNVYWGYLQRGAEEYGYGDWLAVMAQCRQTGTCNPYQAVRDGFADSPEFAESVALLCAGGEAASPLWQLTDHLGTVRVVLNASGGVRASHDTLPFGDEVSAGEELPAGRAPALGAGEESTGLHDWRTTIRSRYAGLEKDAATGLEHTPWRKYDSWMGRWTSPDPYMGSMSIGDPQSLNRYSYCYNDPVNYVDPGGQIPIAVFAISGVVGALVGASGSAVGQIIANGGFNNFSWKAVGVAAGVGFVAGVAAPVAATTFVGAAALGAVANVAQYWGTQTVTGQQFSYTEAAISGGIGAVAGPLAGRFTKGTAFEFLPGYNYDPLSRVTMQNANTAATIAANTGLTTLIRNAGVSIGSNALPTDTGASSNNTPVSGSTRDAFDQRMDTLAFLQARRPGMSAADQAFFNLHLLSMMGGRIVNLGSLGGVTVTASGGGGSTRCNVDGLLNCPPVNLVR